MSATLADRWDSHAQGLPPTLTAHDLVQYRRLFMAGALQCLALQGFGATKDQLLAECIQFGRAIGTPAETAR